jgi:hypothetical protein
MQVVEEVEQILQMEELMDQDQEELAEVVMVEVMV